MSRAGQLSLPLKPTRAKGVGAWHLRALGYALHVVNSDPPTTGRESFYSLKKRLLARFGAPDGFDIQHIKKPCWTCNGTGIYRHDYKGKLRCNRCYSGVYQESWIKLDRWLLGGFRFHNPVERVEFYQGNRQLERREIWSLDSGYRGEIEGRIEHYRSSGHIADEVWYWLALVFDRETFAGVLGRCGHIGRHWSRWLPMCVLGTMRMRWQMHCAKLLGWHGEWSSFRETQGKKIEQIDSHLRWQRERWKPTLAELARGEDSEIPF